MKTKNIILGITAVLFAIGSAFASRLMVAPDYISVLYQGAVNFKCTVIPLECNNLSPVCCKVNVARADGSILQAGVYDLDTDKVNCTNILRDSRPVIGVVTKPTPIISVRGCN